MPWNHHHLAPRSGGGWGYTTTLTENGSGIIKTKRTRHTFLTGTLDSQMTRLKLDKLVIFSILTNFDMTNFQSFPEDCGVLRAGRGWNSCRCNLPTGSIPAICKKDPDFSEWGECDCEKFQALILIQNQIHFRQEVEQLDHWPVSRLGSGRGFGQLHEKGPSRLQGKTDDWHWASLWRHGLLAALQDIAQLHCGLFWSCKTDLYHYYTRDKI